MMTKEHMESLGFTIEEVEMGTVRSGKNMSKVHSEMILLAREIDILKGINTIYAKNRVKENKKKIKKLNKIEKRIDKEVRKLMGLK